MADEAPAETPYERAKRLHALGTAGPEVERALREMGLDEDEARIAARAGRGEAGVATSGPQLQSVPELPATPPTEPPTHPCPTHAAWPVLATCARCGKFICARCLREAGWQRLPESQQCPECEQRAPLKAQIAGWLILPALHIALVAPLSGAKALMEDVTTLPKVSGALMWPVLLEATFYASYLAFALYTALSFFQKRRRTVLLMIIFYVLAICSALLSVGLNGWIEGITGNKVPDDEGGLQTLRALVSSAIWISYFLVSKRVRETFVVP